MAEDSVPNTGVEIFLGRMASIFRFFYCSLLLSVDDLNNQTHSLQWQKSGFCMRVFVLWVLTLLLTPLVASGKE